MKLYDSQTRQVIDLEDLCPDRQVRFYSCGPTVYDYPHIGNWYAFLRWDLVVRCLEANQFDVCWVMNITDVGHLVSDADDGEDKLVAGARREGRTAQEIAKYYGDYFINALGRLNFRRPDHLPKATEHIPEQIDLVQRLVDAGVTYKIADGLYYDTSRWPEYGRQLTNQSQAAPTRPRVDANDEKRQPSDFALWKLTPAGQRRDMEWPSPWGVGFPGWHLECSAMAHHYLGSPLTIHAGGIDHIPIHHTNEIAQSQVGYGQPLAHIWLHANFVLVDGQKMSKSLNNCYRLEDVIKAGYSLAELRLAVLASGYRHQADFSWRIMPAARRRYQSLLGLAAHRFQLSQTQAPASFLKEIKSLPGQIIGSLSDDLNSPQALAICDQFCQRWLDQPWPLSVETDLVALLNRLDDLFGLDLLGSFQDLDSDQKKLLKARAEARAGGDYHVSDRIRRQIEQTGIQIRDVGDHQIWQPQPDSLARRDGSPGSGT